MSQSNLTSSEIDRREALVRAAVTRQQLRQEGRPLPIVTSRSVIVASEELTALIRSSQGA